MLTPTKRSSCSKASCASILFPPPLGGFQGQASDFLIHAEEMQRTKHRVTRLYAEHCGRTYEEVERTLDRDRYMTSEQALEWGLIDRNGSRHRCGERASRASWRWPGELRS
ncbi:ATP-dependent Clp protease proteolytic subunit [Cupriavidus basilensis]|uniref:ATP-dependent Clp protease proteolytic subunit n=1 Tax=Cupriavidus basilensis TaxID=68895 RepID=UPI0039F69913